MCLTTGGRKTSWHRRSVCQQNSQVKPRVLGQAQHKSRQLTSRRDISKPLQYDFEQRSRQRAGRRRRSGRSVLSRRRQGVHPTPWRAPSAAHSKHMRPAERRCPDNASATPGRTSDRKRYQQSGGAQTTPARRQGVHPTPWQAATAAHSAQMLPAERRCPDDARAYIQPLGQQRAPHTARKCYRQSGGDARAYIRPLGKQQGPHTAAVVCEMYIDVCEVVCERLYCDVVFPDDASATPGRTSDPLASSNCRTQHANATGRAAVPRRRQGDARAYIRPLGKQQGPHTAAVVCERCM